MSLNVCTAKVYNRKCVCTNAVGTEVYNRTNMHSFMRGLCLGFDWRSNDHPTIKMSSAEAHYRRIACPACSSGTPMIDGDRNFVDPIRLEMIQLSCCATSFGRQPSFLLGIDQAHDPTKKTAMHAVHARSTSLSFVVGRTRCTPRRGNPQPRYNEFKAQQKTNLLKRACGRPASTLPCHPRSLLRVATSFCTCHSGDRP
jgi:hypothetical protein